MKYVTMEKSLFDETMKLLSDCGAVNTDTYKDLQGIERELLSMNIDNISQLISNDGVEVIKIVKAIMLDGKITLGDIDELWKMAMYLIKIAGKIKSVAGEIKDLTTNEIETLIVEVIEFYKKVINKEDQKFIGALQKK